MVPRARRQIPAGNRRVSTWKHPFPSGKVQVPTRNARVPTGNAYVQNGMRGNPAGLTQVPRRNARVPAVPACRCIPTPGGNGFELRQCSRKAAKPTHGAGRTSTLLPGVDAASLPIPGGVALRATMISGLGAAQPHQLSISGFADEHLLSPSPPLRVGDGLPAGRKR